MIILQTLIDGANVAIIKKSHNIACRLAYLHFYKGQSQCHTQFDLANITVVPNIMSNVVFRLAHLEPALTYYKGQLGCRNSVKPNI